MAIYATRRLALMGFTLWIVSILVFSMVRIVPGDTVTAMIVDAGVVPESQIEAVREELGIDRPFLVQYVSWARGLVRGDFGDSLVRRQSTLIEIREALPVTLELAAAAILLSIILGVPLGALAAVRRNGVADRATQLFGSLGMSVPEFFVGTVMVIFLAKWFHYQAPLGYRPPWEDPLTNLNQIWLPALLIGVRLSAVTMRMTRSVMIEVLTQDYIRTARAKGLGQFQIVVGHALRNAVLPVITVVGGQLGGLLGGAFVMESLFSLPGLGTSTLTAINRRDYSQVQTNALFVALVVVNINLIVDISYAALDPRVRLR